MGHQVVREKAVISIKYCVVKSSQTGPGAQGLEKEMQDTAF